MHATRTTNNTNNTNNPPPATRHPPPVLKVVVLGGSGVATPELVDAIVQSPGRRRPIELVLVGRTLDKLERVAGVARSLAEGDPLLTVSHTTDVEAALTGAAYAINQVRVGGLEARAFDESFPHELGLPGEETVGPGGFANASRTIPVVLQYARLMERICPGDELNRPATLLSFVNPSSLVQYAVTRYTRVPVIGLCDSPVTLTRDIARALGAPVEELVVDYVGMHHFGWVTGVWWRGRDVLPEVLDKAAEVARDVEPAIVQAIGAVPGAYLNYVFHPDRMLARKVGKRPRAEELIELQDEILAAYGEIATEVATTDQKATEVATTDQKATEVATTNRKATEVATTDQKATEVATTNRKVTEVATTDQKATEVATTNQATEVATTNQATEVATTDRQKPAALARRKARWYQAIIAPVLLALVEGRPARFILNVVNGRIIPWLPAEAVVEVPTLLEGGQVRPLAVGPVPPDVKALIQANCAYEMLAVEAIVERDRAKALRALLINPIVHTYDQAAGVLERAWAER